jgi:type IV secretion system protein VirB9
VRNIFIKPKLAASAPNNLAVVTDRRSYAFRLVVLPERDVRVPTYRLSIRAPVVRAARPQVLQPALQAPSPAAQPHVPSPSEAVSERIKATPEIVNAEYSIAEGKRSADIVPTLIFDDGRFTYLRFPNNREVPAVFHVLDDGSETVVNTRMEGDLLVVDRVSRRLMLRSGWAVIGVWNEAFDLDGIPPAPGTTVNGVARVLGNEAGTARTPILRGGQP